MKNRENASFYRERMALAVVALLFSSMFALYLLFADTNRVSFLGDPFKGSSGSVVVQPEAERVAKRIAEGVVATPETPIARVTPDKSPSDSASETVGSFVQAASAPVMALASRAPALTNPLEVARKLAGEREWTRAIAIYDSLHAAQPEARPLAIERARVLAWSGDPLKAAVALGQAFGNDLLDPDLRLEQANFLWWAGDLARADSVVGLVADLPVMAAAADSLRTRIREGAEPDVALAERWLRSRPTALEHLLLARALARDGRGAEAVPHYRAAQRVGSVSDVVSLEAAAIAAGADSLSAASEALVQYLRSQPDDRSARLRLARYYAWSGRTVDARREYAVLLQGSLDPSVRFEVAQLEAWSGNIAGAEAELGRVIEADPRHAGALKLMGDIARWRGDWRTALSLYDAASRVDTGLEGLTEGIAEAERLRLAAEVPSPSSGSWLTAVETFSDSEKFRWFGARATHLWTRPAHAIEVAVEHNAWDGADRHGATQLAIGFGAEVTATTSVREGLALSGQVGARTLEGGFRLPTWGAKLSYEPQPRHALVFGYTHQAAIRRASTLAAWHAETISDLVQLTAARPVLGLDLWSRAEVERFSSTLGQTSRVAGTLAASLPLTSGWTASWVVSGLATDGPSPILTDLGPLYWSPETYASASVGLAYATGASDRWRATGRLAPGYVWVRERPEGEHRFPATRAAILGFSGDASYLLGDWRLGAGADWNGSLRAGYRAAALRLQLSQPLGSR